MQLNASPNPFPTTTIIFDYNNLCFRNAHIFAAKAKNERDWSLLAFSIFKTIYNFTKEIFNYLESNDTVEVIIAQDSKTGYWRRELYPPYKINRAKNRENDKIDWDRAFEEFDKLADTISSYIPWKVVRVPMCEADDIIYALTREPEQDYIIYSSDSDYLQLLSEHVLIYNPHRQEYVEFPITQSIKNCSIAYQTPEVYLKYAILTGQKLKDNVYNILTPTDWDCAKRKPGFGITSASKYIMEDCLHNNLEQRLRQDGLYENYLRNKKLIDLSEIPKEYSDKIYECYNSINSDNLNLDKFFEVYFWPSFMDKRSELDFTLTSFVEGKRPELDVNTPSEVDTEADEVDKALKDTLPFTVD